MSTPQFHSFIRHCDASFALRCFRSWCPFCTEASIILQSHGVMDLKVGLAALHPEISSYHPVKVVEADHRPDELEFMNALKGMTELKVWVCLGAGDGRRGGG